MSEPFPEDPLPNAESALDPYSQVHQALERARQEGELGPDWYMTDFLVVGVAQSFLPEHKDVSLCFHVGPENDMPPHRILGLLKYALTRFEHQITCCHEADDED